MSFNPQQVAEAERNLAYEELEEMRDKLRRWPAVELSISDHIALALVHATLAVAYSNMEE